MLEKQGPAKGPGGLMQAGQLIEKVSIQKPAQSIDNFGGVQDGWEDQFECRAEFIYAGGGETLQAARLEGRGVLKIRIRSFTRSRQIEQDWRLLDARRNTVYNIREVDSVTDRRWVYILAERGVAT
jgi:head-tail adaptor